MRILHRDYTGTDGQSYRMVRPADDADVEFDSGMSDEVGEAIVRAIRQAGGKLWLVHGHDNTVRCRIFTPFAVSDEMLEFLQANMRPISKAVDRLGADDPPPNNPYGDRPLHGDRWDWSKR